MLLSEVYIYIFSSHNELYDILCHRNGTSSSNLDKNFHGHATCHLHKPRNVGQRSNYILTLQVGKFVYSIWAKNCIDILISLINKPVKVFNNCAHYGD